MRRDEKESQRRLESAVACMRARLARRVLGSGRGGLGERAVEGGCSGWQK